jgi:hypothetical protein
VCSCIPPRMCSCSMPGCVWSGACCAECRGRCFAGLGCRNCGGRSRRVGLRQQQQQQQQLATSNWRSTSTSHPKHVRHLVCTAKCNVIYYILRLWSARTSRTQLAQSTQSAPCQQGVTPTAKSPLNASRANSQSPPCRRFPEGPRTSPPVCIRSPQRFSAPARSRTRGSQIECGGLPAISTFQHHSPQHPSIVGPLPVLSCSCTMSLSVVFNVLGVALAA